MNACVVCEELYSPACKVMVLPCGHSFCGDCTLQFQQCPMCRHSYDPTQVPINYLANALIQTLNTTLSQNDNTQIFQHAHEDKEKEEIEIHVCGICENTPDVFCTQCSDYLCEACDKTMHKLAAYKTHNRKNYLEIKNPTIGTCNEHPHRNIELFCRQDQEAICLQCCSEYLHGSHSGHDCVALDDAAEEISYLVKYEILFAEELIDNCAKDLLQIQQNVHHLIHEATEFHKNYITSAARMLEELTKREKVSMKYRLFLNTLKHEEKQDCIEQLTILRRLQKHLKEFDTAFDSVPKEFVMLNDFSEKLSKNTKQRLLPGSFPIASHVWISCESDILQRQHWMMLQGWYGCHSARWKLLFQTARDGFSAAKFHETCDGKHNTLVIIQANDYIFGGFTPLPWNCSDDWIPGWGETWIFSLTNPQKHPVKVKCIKRDYEIGGSIKHGPTFGGGHDIYISDDCNRNQLSYTNLGHSYRSSCFENGTFLVGERFFTVQSYEVFVLED